MKLYCILVFTLLYSLPLSAQRVQVVFKDGGYPLGYSVIYVNDLETGFADSLGFFNLNGLGLKKGDKIGASSVGMSKETIVYDKDFKEGLGTIELGSEITLKQVRVKGRNRSVAVFNKEVNKRLNYDWFVRYKGQYNITLENKGNYTGKFDYSILPPLYISEKKVNDLDIFSDSEADSTVFIEIATALRATLIHSIISPSTPLVTISVYWGIGKREVERKSKHGLASLAFSLGEPYLPFAGDYISPYYAPISLKKAMRECASGIIQVRPFCFDKDMKIAYKGQEGMKHQFVLTRPYFENDSTFLQHHETKMFVDDYSLEVDRAEVIWIDVKQGVVLKLNSNYTYSKRPDLYPYRYPTDVKGKMFLEYGPGETDYMNLDIELKNITIEDYNPIRDNWGMPFYTPLNYDEMNLVIL